MSDDLNEVTCNECGIKFGFGPKIEELWRKSGKTFYCPNGHSLCWTLGKETPEQKENVTLKAQVKDLKAKLESTQQELTAQKKRADELSAELDIWRPSTAEDKKAE